jgi:hypothetical protein
MTYSASVAGSDVEGNAGLPSRVTHEDSSLDHVDGASSQRGGRGADVGSGVRTAAEGIVHDLTTLFTKSQFRFSVTGQV